MKLMSVVAARQAMLATITPLASEVVLLDDALGRVLAQDVVAVRDQPPFTNSAMDGWAVVSGSTPGTLAIVGESAAGRGYGATLSAGEAVRIFTGAALPDGADSVVIQEDATRSDNGVTVPAARSGDNVRQAGRDFRSGDILVAAGARLDPWRISLCASAGQATVRVVRRPRVVVLSTGEEIVEAPNLPGPFQIYDSGSAALVAMITTWGGEATKISGISDTLQAVTAAIAEAKADLVVTLGGASVGDYDLVRAAGQALGLVYQVESVAVRPGKPTFFGVLGDGRAMLGLPGNPASAFVCAELFLKSLLLAYQGREATPTLLAAQTLAVLPANGPREHWMRARLAESDGLRQVRAYGDQDSSLVSVFAAADALVCRPPGALAAGVGDLVQVLVLDRL